MEIKDLVWILKLNFNDKFINLSKLQKIELYLLPILLIFLIYINIPTKKAPNQNNHIKKQQIKIYQKKIKQLKDKKIKYTKLQILQRYESLANKYNIEIKNINFTNKYTKLTFQGEYLNSITFFKILERLNDIISFDLTYTDHILTINTLIKTQTFQNLNIQTTIDTNIANPFIKIGFEQNNTDIPSKAIIGNWVILDNHWYKLHDRYKKYIIKKIAKDYILLGFGTKTIKMEIFNEQKQP